MFVSSRAYTSFSLTGETQGISAGRILSLLNKYSPLFLTSQPTWIATNLTAFPATNSNVVQLASYHSVIYGSGEIMENDSRGGSEVRW